VAVPAEQAGDDPVEWQAPDSRHFFKEPPMNRFKPAFLLPVIALFTAMPLMAQQQRVSPHETISTTIDGGRVIVVYGRPYMKNPKTGEVRKIWGGLVPFGQVWRAGADEATMFVTERPLTVGGKSVPAGAYSLFLLPKADGSATLILNKVPGQWGAYKYDEKQDLARIDLKRTELDTTADQFTMALERGQPAGGTLRMMWDKVQYSVDIAGQK
jgi:hypothetical protein